jgi:hypothetical protein
MARVALDPAHLMRLAELLSDLRATATGDLAARAGKAEEWLKHQVESQACPDQNLRDFVNSMRREWQEFSRFTALEENHFRANQTDLASLKAGDWEMMRDFLAYAPRQNENLFQVERREWFLKAPQDTLMAARKWSRTHREQRKIVPIRREQSTADPETIAMIHEILGPLMPPEPEPPPPKPAPKIDAMGQTRFID